MTELKTDEVKFCGYLPGAIGKITELHATYYSKHWGLDLSFESQVATELSEFLLRFNKAHDGFWVATVDEKIVASVAIDGSSGNTDGGARLRWFIVAPECQGRGIGKVLLREAIAFCKRANFSRVYLWTFAGLNTARRLYEECGFTLCQEHSDAQWGNTLTHQMFQLDLSRCF